MKFNFSLFALLLFTCAGFSQSRYYDKVFSQVGIDSNIVFGNNYTYDILKLQLGLTSEDLTLDIYYPEGDIETKRPLIIWAHGGSFLGGTKDDADIVYFCNEFAKRGFVCASINYRLGYELPIDSTAAVRTVYRALQDGRASVRYMRSVANQYNIDKNRVYFGGTSAGAFIALNIGFLNLPEEVPAYVDTSARTDINLNPRFGLDGIEGKTNDIQESSEIQGIINFCGATKVTKWMDDAYSRNIPMISMHGTEDGTVPYATRVINLNDLTPIPDQVPIPIVGVQGSYDIDKHADNQGYSSKFYTWYGADHVPYINFQNDAASAAYMDTLMQFTVKYVYEDFLGFGLVDGVSENDPPCDFNNGEESPCLTGIDNQVIRESLSIYPNPATNRLSVEVKNSAEFQILSLDGRVLQQGFVTHKENGIELKGLATGSYLLMLKEEQLVKQTQFQVTD